MILLLTETDWNHIENILGGLGFFIAFILTMWLLLR